MSGTTTNISIQQLCYQRSKQLLFNNPQFRFTPVSPYNGNYTKFQLDMRRKAEVLKYNNNTSSTKGNNFTKAELFVQLVNGKAPTQNQSFQSVVITTLDANGNYNTVTVNYPDKLNITYLGDSANYKTNVNAVKINGYKGYYIYDIIVNGLICSSDRLKPTPTFACNVPGPVINLIDDETVPLYNYINYSISDAAYSQSERETINQRWLTKPVNNVLIPSGIPTNIGMVLITSIIDNPTYDFLLKIPLGIFSINNSPITIKINTIILDVYYSGNFVGEYYSHSLGNSTMYPVTKIINNFVPSTNTSIYNYFAVIDTINIEHMLLNTSPNFVYDFQLTINATISSSSTAALFCVNYANGLFNLTSN